LANPGGAPGAFGGSAGVAFGASGFAGYGGGIVNGDNSGGGMTCGCRVADRPNSGSRQLGLAALAAGLMIARRRRGARAAR
jgi:MYXO-CTERM domain-containing protein